jgi:SAM-dependent methyltransferase
MNEKNYLRIAAHYEACLERYGDNHRGVDWPRPEDVDVRYRVMVEVVRPFPPDRPVRLLDFGCGASHLYEYIRREGLHHIQYAGLDISERFVALSRAKFPQNEYWCADVLTAADADLPRADYAVMNGVFTEKTTLSYDEMVDFFTATVARVFRLVEHGVAFNVMSKHVDWERDDLFHLPFDQLASILKTRVSRHFVIRNDYGLYEYTVYAYRTGVARSSGG